MFVHCCRFKAVRPQKLDRKGQSLSRCFKVPVTHLTLYEKACDRNEQNEHASISIGVKQKLIWIEANVHCFKTS